MDIQNYMNEVGQRARAASRAMARADTAVKNQALTLIAAAIRRDAALLKEANRRDMEAARAAGLSPAAVIARHIVPNLMGPVVVYVTLTIPTIILAESFLSFLGLGTPPPAPSLGSMIFEARTLVTIAPWTMIAPGAIVVLLVVGLNLLGDGLRDSLDPRKRGKR